jgi:hypothetical protein
MKIEDIIKESPYRNKQRDILLQRIADADDPIERAKLMARFEAQFPELYGRDQEGGVAQGMDQADEINSIAVAKERGAGYELNRATAERDEYLKRQAKTSPYKEPDPTSDILPGEPGSGLERKDNSQAILNTEKSKRDQAQDIKARRNKQKELDRMKANAGMKDDDYKTSPGSKRTAQDLALDKEYTYKADDGRRLKYKQGDIRNAFHSSPDSRKAGSDKVIRGDRVGKRLVDKKPVSRTNQDDRAK